MEREICKIKDWNTSGVKCDMTQTQTEIDSSGWFIPFHVLISRLSSLAVIRIESIKLHLLTFFKSGPYLLTKTVTLLKMTVSEVWYWLSYFADDEITSISTPTWPAE